MTLTTAAIARPTAAHYAGDRKSKVVGALLSIALHVLLLFALLYVAQRDAQRARGAPTSKALQAQWVIVSTVTAPETLQEQPEVLQERKPATDAPLPKAVTKPRTQARPPQASASSASAASAAPAKTLSEEGEEREDVVGRIRDNWLEPPGFGKNYRCRLRVDYAAGGKIVALHFVRSCGTQELDDSIKRAVWKSQMLPSFASAREAGSFEFDFTP